MADVSQDALVLAFQKRYDYLAARTQLKQALKGLGFDEKKAYSDEECQRLVGYLADNGEREVQIILDALSPPAPAEEKKDEGKKDEKEDDKKGGKGKKK